MEITVCCYGKITGFCRQRILLHFAYSCIMNGELFIYYFLSIIIFKRHNLSFRLAFKNKSIFIYERVGMSSIVFVDTEINPKIKEF